MAIGGSVIGGAVATGDHNFTEVRYRKVTLPMAESIDMRDLLVGLDTEDWRKIANALVEAESDAAKPQADKHEIGGALKRTMGHAGKAAEDAAAAEAGQFTRFESCHLGKRPVDIHPDDAHAGRPFLVRRKREPAGARHLQIRAHSASGKVVRGGHVTSSHPPGTMVLRQEAMQNLP